MDISLKFDPEVVIGEDTLSMAGTICARYGNRIMIAADHALDSQTVGRLKAILEDSKIEAIIFDGVQEDSSVEMAENIVELCCAAHCSAIIGFGGPKTQTIARMAAMMAPMRMYVFELLDGRKYLNKFLPFISIPTVCIDAFAFTDYFIVTDPRDRLIKRIDSLDKVCAAVIVDTSLFQLQGASINTAAFIFDGLSMSIEAYCSAKSNFLSDAILERAINFFARLIKGGAGDIKTDVYTQAGFLSAFGNSVSSPGAGTALSFAISARSPATKQECSTALLPFIADRLARARPEKMARVGSFLGNAGKAASVAEGAASAVDSIRRCMGALKVQSNLKDYGVSLDKLTAAAEAARSLDFVSNSPWTVSEEDTFDILKQIL